MRSESGGLSALFFARKIFAESGQMFMYGRHAPEMQKIPAPSKVFTTDPAVFGTFFTFFEWLDFASDAFSGGVFAFSSNAKSNK